MNQEELKQRLGELIEHCSCRYSPPCTGECAECINVDMRDRQIEYIADHLIANGVTIRERGEWQPYYETFVDDAGRETEPIQTGWVCSVCGENDNKYPFCPHCGADMRGVKDE